MDIFSGYIYADYQRTVEIVTDILNPNWIEEKDYTTYEKAGLIVHALAEGPEFRTWIKTCEDAERSRRALIADEEPWTDYK